MARGAVRGAITAGFGLIVLQVVTTHSGSSKVATAFDAANSLVKRAMDHSVPAIPDFAGGAGAGSTAEPDPVTAPSFPVLPNRVPIPGAPAIPYF